MPSLAGFLRVRAAPVRSGGAMPGKGKAAAKGPAEPGAAAGPVVAAGGGSVRVAVRAKPGARCSAVTDVTAEAVGVAIAAPPSEGEANAELCRYLSKVLEVKKSEVILEKTSFCSGEFPLGKICPLSCSLSKWFRKCFFSVEQTLVDQVRGLE
ncbi:UPF0235 protein C15orf40 homolog isoform X1 [Hirundo rustica]|uniref:UPF0235 protein C15orf40 homolog isoform X1 n=1 Tax=Hirundo rustica TaxID=43150 RepID=UPI001A94B8A6|nr:UPF0235 protein C15orf40 homolog isoform X1 [Hirundo rustica]